MIRPTVETFSMVGLLQRKYSWNLKRSRSLISKFEIQLNGDVNIFTKRMLIT